MFFLLAFSGTSVSVWCSWNCQST